MLSFFLSVCVCARTLMLTMQQMLVLWLGWIDGDVEMSTLDLVNLHAGIYLFAFVIDSRFDKQLDA